VRGLPLEQASVETLVVGVGLDWDSTDSTSRLGDSVNKEVEIVLAFRRPSDQTFVSHVVNLIHFHVLEPMFGSSYVAELNTSCWGFALDPDPTNRLRDARPPPWIALTSLSEALSQAQPSQT
jgi:hypothetical protein